MELSNVQVIQQAPEKGAVNQLLLFLSLEKSDSINAPSGGESKRVQHFLEPHPS
jgi:hypothetical protein